MLRNCGAYVRRSTKTLFVSTYRAAVLRSRVKTFTGSANDPLVYNAYGGVKQQERKSKITWNEIFNDLRKKCSTTFFPLSILQPPLDNVCHFRERV